MPLPLPRPLNLGCYTYLDLFPENFLESQGPPTLGPSSEGWGQGSVLPGLETFVSCLGGLGLPWDIVSTLLGLSGSSH